jgi:hypothetical protein
MCTTYRIRKIKYEKFLQSGISWFFFDEPKMFSEIYYLKTKCYATKIINQAYKTKTGKINIPPVQKIQSPKL